MLDFLGLETDSGAGLKQKKRSKIAGLEPRNPKPFKFESLQKGPVRIRIWRRSLSNEHFLVLKSPPVWGLQILGFCKVPRV